MRFHPIEIVLSMHIKFAVAAGLGTPALAVLIFERCGGQTPCLERSRR